jgi:hypothetical protein
VCVSIHRNGRAVVLLRLPRFSNRGKETRQPRLCGLANRDDRDELSQLEERRSREPGKSNSMGLIDGVFQHFGLCRHVRIATHVGEWRRAERPSDRSTGAVAHWLKNLQIRRGDGARKPK